MSCPEGFHQSPGLPSTVSFSPGTDLHQSARASGINGMSDDTGDEISREAGRFAEKLQKDVRSWSANESADSDRHDDAAQKLGAQQIKSAMDATKKRAAAKPKAAPEQPAARKPGPFSMSYDGQTTAQHLAARRALGAR
jgi:hypothetical protein